MSNRRLYDILLRHQVYVDGYKNYQTDQWLKVVPLLVKDLKAELDSVSYNTLDEMTKKEFNDFKRKVAKIVAYTFNFWQNELMKELEEFVNVEIKLEEKILANHLINPEDDAKPVKIVTAEAEVESILEDMLPGEEKKRKTLLWLFLLNDIMGSTGMSAKETIDKLGIDSVSKINTEINKAFANNLTIKELKDTIIGTPALKFKDGKIASISRNVVAEIETTVQSFVSTSQSNLFLPFYKRYQWKAILDNRLCETCGFLHNKIFIYGFGPACPAHRKCRCSKIPYTGPMPDESSADAWKQEQPAKVQADFAKSKKLTLDQFGSKLDNILTR